MSTHEDIRYFDHAATSWPKPPEVVEAVVRALTVAGGNPGRGAHPLALAASRTIGASRAALAELLGVEDDRNLLFTPGCTSALNLVLHGGLKPGDRVIVSAVEHNAVARPLAVLGAAGVDVVTARVDADGLLDVSTVERLLADAPTRMVVCQHASNVTGAIQPIGDLADAAHAAGALLVVDGAQAGGHLPLDLGLLGADAYALSGHKGLLGPQGVGALYLAPHLEITELVQGGSGGNSEEPFQPRLRPDRYEAGTPNTPGVAGLGAAAGYLAAYGDDLRAHERHLTESLLEGLTSIPGLRILGPEPGVPRVPVVSVVHRSLAPDEIAFALDRRYGIAVRAGVHCSPRAHEAAGTLKTGAVRFSPGYGLTEDDVAAAIEAMRDVCR